MPENTDRNIDDKQSFESAMERIDEIIRALDAGSLGLEETLSLFGEGATLIAYCNSALEDAKLRMETLLPHEQEAE